MWSFFSKDPSKDLNYEILECVSSRQIDDKTIWTVHNGKKKASGDLVTVFVYQTSPGNEAFVK
jgi:SCY1-like protein 1